MSCISDQVAHEEQMSAGRRETLHLKLQDAKRELTDRCKRRQACLEHATVCRAEAAATDNVHRRIALNASAVRFQLDAEAEYTAIWELTQTIGSIERALNGSPVVLSADEVAGMDDMAGVLA